MRASQRKVSKFRFVMSNLNLENGEESWRKEFMRGVISVNFLILEHRASQLQLCLNTLAFVFCSQPGF